MALKANQRWLLVIFFTFGLAASVSGFLVNTLYFERYSERVALTNAVKKSLERESLLQSFFDQARLNLVTLRNTSAFHDYLVRGEGDGLITMLQTMVAISPTVSQVLVVDALGQPRIRVSRNPDNSGTVVSRGSFLSQSGRCAFPRSLHMQGTDVWFGPPRLYNAGTESLENGEEVLTSALPVRFGGRPRGALVICYDIQPLLDDLLRVPLYDMVVVNADGDVVRHYQDGKSWSRFTEAGSLSSLIPDATEVLASEVYESPRRFARRLDLPLQTPLHLIFSLNEGYLATQEASFREQAFLNLGLTLVLTTIFAVVVVGFVSRLNLTLLDARKHVKELAAKNEQIGQLILHATDGVHVLNQQGNIVQSSQSFADMLGYSLEQARQLNITEWEAGIPRDRLFSVLHKRIASSVPSTFETRHRRMDGTVVDVEVQVRGIEIDGERLLYASSRDITEGKQYKESLEKAVTQRTSELVAARQKAEQANQAKTRFLANVSHEMRTPMHAILSYASLTRRRVEDAKAAGYLDKMIQSADRLNRTLTNLLNLADFEKDAADFNFSRGDLRQIVETLVHEDAGAIAAKDIELRVSGAPELVGEMDVSRIAQVVGHLLENAIQFSPDGASIFVELASGRSSVRDGNLDCLLMSVHDQGIGIPASEQARVFDPFVLGLDTDGKTGGGGMGLAVSQRIIAAHGGRIWIDSPVECAELRMQGSPGHVGTTVHVAIPVRQMRQATRIPAA